MWKKFLVIIPAAAIIIASLVSGTQPKFAVGQDGQRVVLATDSGVVDDKSFNEGSFNGVKEFIHDYYGLDGSQTNYVDGAEHTKIGILNNYKLAMLKKANALVMPGFSHVEPLSDPSASFLNNTTIVLIDGVVQKPNVISILFDSQIAGMQAGFDVSYWGTRKDENGHYQGDISGDGKVTIGAFGGASNKVAVDNYLWGLFLGMTLFNLTIGQEEGSSVEFANSSNGRIEGLRAVNSTDSLFFTGTFSLGDATKSGILGNLIDTRKADIIFPVAGPQIQDVISYRSKPNSSGYSYSPYLVGVDVDQSLAFPNAANEGRFLTSAIKNLSQAAYQALGHAKTLRQKNNPDGSLGEWNTDIWDGTTPKPAKDWSESVIGGKNLIQKHYLKIYEPGTGDQPVGDSDPLLQKVNDIFLNRVGDRVEDYLNGNAILGFAIELKELAEQAIDRSAIQQSYKEIKHGN